ncbi:MAG: FG-GAP-like repeat-containing protein [Candidatus Thermoplasmatota archaeon]|nr:FG-GAP-like repeat-containing protein [Candidatus Thermoplasmatota archaeon]
MNHGLSITMRFGIASLVTIVLLIIPFGIFASDTRDDPIRDMEYISLGGTELVEDAASVRIIGEPFLPVGGALGTYSWIGDVNGDGIADLAVSAPQSRGRSDRIEDGRLYVFYGRDGWPDRIVDLDEVTPDITIYGNNTLEDNPGGNRNSLSISSAIAVGDYDGDGYNDLAVCAPTTNQTPVVIIFYSVMGNFPAWISVKIDDFHMGQIGRSAINHTTIFADSSEGPLLTTVVRNFGGINKPTDAQISRFMKSFDIDGDGIDDLVGGGLFDKVELSCNVRILWGGRRHYDARGLYVPDMRLTIILDESPSRFGNTLDVGDIDGDGYYDMVVGAPFSTRDDRGLIKAGALYIYFNISTLKNMSTTDHLSIPQKILYGSGMNDELGRAVQLIDLNRDGKDDIIVSAPNADGPGNDQRDRGEIFVFYGRVPNAFPTVMDAESDFDRMLLGPDGRMNREGSGFRLGEMFRAGDITGDGLPDMVVAVKGKDLPSIGTDLRYTAGTVMFYEHSTLFSPGKNVVQLAYPSSLFTLEGMDIEDVLGYHIELGDLNGDGIDDIVIGAPNGDGVDNERPRAGEVYVIYSTPIRLGRLIPSGPGYDNGSVFASGGRVRFSTEMISSRPKYITEAIFDIGENGPLIVSVKENGTVNVFDPYSCVGEVNGAIEFDNGSLTGIAWFELEFKWSYPWRRGNNVVLSVKDHENRTTVRTYRNVFVLEKDLVFGEDIFISVNGKPLHAPGIWVKGGDELTLGGIPVVYRDRPDREVRHGEIELWAGVGEDVFITPYTSNWSITDEASISPHQDYFFEIRLVGEGLPIPLAPEVESGHHIRIFVDDRVPEIPSASMYQGDQTMLHTGKPGSWTVCSSTGFGPFYDSGGSGVKEYWLSDRNGSTEPILMPGGLMGTYFLDVDMTEYAFQVVDEGVDFAWGLWGPYPEKHILPPTSFSARWHGWLMVENEGPYMFQLTGRGEGIILLDGEVLIPRDDLGYSPKSKMLELVPGRFHEIVLYYFHTCPSEASSFHFRWIGPEGSMEPVPYSVMYHPENRTDVFIANEVDNGLSIVAVDWVGHISESTLSFAPIDAFPPMIETTSIPAWTNRTSISLRARISEVACSNVSGLDSDSVMFRVLRDKEQFGTWQTSGIRFEDISYENDIVMGFTAFFKLSLDRGFTGTVELSVSDLAGNVARSPRVPIGVDMEPPSVLLMDPDPRNVMHSQNLSLRIRLVDPGSGIDLGSLAYRLDHGNGWSAWLNAGDSGYGNDMIFAHDIDLMEERNDIQYLVLDNAGNMGLSSVYEYVFSPTLVNMPPIPVISSPMNGTVIVVGWPVDLSAEGTRDDGLGLYDPVRFSWSSNISGHLGSGLKLRIYLIEGVHRITLHADDGFFNVSRSIEVNVVSPRSDPHTDGGARTEDADLLMALMLLLFSLSMLTGFIVIAGMAYRKKRIRELKFKIPGETREE